MDQSIHRELSGDIIAAAMKVLNTLRTGLDEKLYENALLIELVNRGYRVDQQKTFPVHYEGRFIGRLIPDFIVEERVIVDPKVVENLAPEHTLPNAGISRNYRNGVGPPLKFQTQQTAIQTRDPKTANRRRVQRMNSLFSSVPSALSVSSAVIPAYAPK